LKPTDTEDAVMEAVMEAEAEDCTINSEHVAEIYTQESDVRSENKISKINALKATNCSV
jgi:transcriptional/translational regulatory protein YebC/TACO1